MKELNGAELAGYMKANQAHLVRSLRAQRVAPKLVIIRNNDSPVIAKYVQLKQQYGEDIGVVVEDWLRPDLALAISEANSDPDVHGVIVQLPLAGEQDVAHLVDQIAPAKDVDGLGVQASFDSATATAINWLLTGYSIDLEHAKIALVGRGKLVGAPLERMWLNSGYDVTTFRSHDSLDPLDQYDIIVSATGVPRLIQNHMVKPGATVVDAGTASEGGVLVGDVDDTVRARRDLAAITPKIGGVGPLTIAALFEHVLIAARRTLTDAAA